MKPYISTIPHANSEESFHVYRGSEEALAYRSSWASHEAPEIKALHDTFILLPWEMLFALSNSVRNILLFEMFKLCQRLIILPDRIQTGEMNQNVRLMKWHR